MLVGDATVMDVHRTGLKMHVLGMIGLVYEDHLANVTDIPSNYTVGTNVKATVLYVHPNGTSPYLTLQSPRPLPYVVNAQVIRQ
jgi:hypothetical protein